MINTQEPSGKPGQAPLIVGARLAAAIETHHVGQVKHYRIASAIGASPTRRLNHLPGHHTRRAARSRPFTPLDATEGVLRFRAEALPLVELVRRVSTRRSACSRLR